MIRHYQDNMCRGQDLKETALSLEAHAMVVEMASSTPTTDWQPDNKIPTDHF
jgi:hypothetical protein